MWYVVRSRLVWRMGDSRTCSSERKALRVDATVGTYYTAT